jgi:hypothetical protein
MGGLKTLYQLQGSVALRVTRRDRQIRMEENILTQSATGISLERLRKKPDRHVIYTQRHCRNDQVRDWTAECMGFDSLR